MTTLAVLRRPSGRDVDVPPSEGFVYFVQEEEAGPIKVGWARTEALVARRLESHRTGNPRALYLRALVPGGRDLEASIHHDFRDCRIRGEWFEPTPELATYVEYAEAKMRRRRGSRDLNRRFNVLLVAEARGQALAGALERTSA